MTYVLDPMSAESGLAFDAALDAVVRFVELGGLLTPDTRTEHVATATFRRHPAGAVIAGYDRVTITNPSYVVSAATYVVDAALVPVLTGGGSVEEVAAARVAIDTDRESPVDWVLSTRVQLDFAAAVVAGDAAAAAAVLPVFAEVSEKLGEGSVIDLIGTGLVAAARQRGLDVPAGPEPLIAEGLIRA